MNKGMFEISFDVLKDILIKEHPRLKNSHLEITCVDVDNFEERIKAKFQFVTDELISNSKITTIIRENKEPQNIFMYDNDFKEGNACLIKRSLFVEQDKRITNLNEVRQGKEYKYTGNFGIGIDIKNKEIIFGTVTTTVKAIKNIDILNKRINKITICLLETVNGSRVEFEIKNEDIEKFKNAKGNIIFL